MESGGESKLNANLGVEPATNNGYQQPSHLTEQGQGNTNNNVQNPFLVPTVTINNDTANIVDINHGSSSTHHHSSTDDLLVGGNLFHEETTTDNKVPVEVFDTWQNQPSTYQIVPTNVESHNPFQVSTEQGQQVMASAEANDVDKFLPKHEHYDDATEQHPPSISPGFILEHGTNKGPEIQNPPVQVMERSKESVTTSSQYVFPSHVFARNTTNAPVEWSTASNESLFSIYMGNMSFSSDHPCFKSCELDNQSNTSPNNNQQPQAPVNKFNDISQRTAELHEENSKVTEAQAAETMREVIMENSQTDQENVGKKEDKKFSSRHQSDGSANSYAFQTSADRDKSISSKSVGEKQQPQKQAEQNEAANAADQAQTPKSNAPMRRWLNCFSCCTLCR